MNVRKCQNCHCSSNEDFKQVANLKKSGLMIYIHDNKRKKRNYDDYSGNNIILHNTSNRDIKRFDYIVELCQYRTKCLRCKTLIQRVRNAIDDITIINKNEIIGICDYCKRSHLKNKCKRCEYIIEKFVNNKTVQNENRDERLKLWLSKLQQILISVIDAKVICRHNICLDFEYNAQLHRLLKSLNSNITTRQPEIDVFPELFDLKDSGFDVSESKFIIEDLISHLKYKRISENADIELSSSSSRSDSECICKYLVDNKKDKKDNKDNKDNKPGKSLEIQSQENVLLSKTSIANGNSKKGIEKGDSKKGIEKGDNKKGIEKWDSKKEIEKGDNKKGIEKWDSKKEIEKGDNKKGIEKWDSRKRIEKGDNKKGIEKWDSKKEIDKGDNKKGIENWDSKTEIEKGDNKKGIEKWDTKKEIEKGDNKKGIEKWDSKKRIEKGDNKNRIEKWDSKKGIRKGDSKKGKGKGDEIKIALSTSSEQQRYSNSESDTFTEKPSDAQKSKVSKKARNKNLRSNKENNLSNEISNNSLKKVMEKRKKKGGQNSEFRLMMQMLKEREKEKKLAEKLGKNEKIIKLPLIKELPLIKKIKKRVIAEDLEIKNSESILECKDEHLDAITEMIKGTNIVHLYSHHHVIEEESEKLPLLFKIHTNISIPEKNNKLISLSTPKSENKHKKHQIEEHGIDSGITRYELSNRKFIDSGWTKLPSTKVMRRMNIYKMKPASDKFNWFKNYMKQEILFYDTGEKFAEINENGGGKWFYKNGNVALNAHNAKDSDTVKRYIIYSSGEEIANGKKVIITILACFDYLGNGVVYDCFGNVRLKYNQSEGMLIDKTISAPCHWKWHTLNDPPVLQQIFLNTYDKSDKNVTFQDDNSTTDNIKKTNGEMIAIELDNFVKEKAHKLKQKFKPLQIRIKVLKINIYFSLRIIDQANIFLSFRCNRMYYKINIGMLLKSDEIIDTDLSDVSEVSIPYDKFPPNSPSIINIQNTLKNVRKYYSSPKKNK